MLAATLFLSACKTSEERAEEHFQSALALVSQGDTDRAIVEFRNTFKLDKTNAEAHRAFADLLRKLGRTKNAYAEYLRLVELEPDDLAGNVALAQMAIELQSWDVAQRYGAKAVALAPEDPAVKVIGVNLRYADAADKKDDGALRTVAAEAGALAADSPDDLSLRRILIDAAVRNQTFDAALTELDAAMKIAPDDRTLWNTRLAILAQMQRLDEVEALLRQMVVKFADDDALKASLLRFYVGRKEPGKAEDFLRGMVADAPAERLTEMQVSLVQFLVAIKGPEAALAEIDKMLAVGGDTMVLAPIRAGIQFQQGDHDAAIAKLQAILEGAEASDQTRRIKIGLAKMLGSTGNPVGARRLVEEVLTEDAGQADAMKMKASWLIQEDKADDAVAMLRTVLDRTPDDVEAITLTAQAYDRNGDHDLARDTLSRAVDASKSAPEPTVRYAAALIEDKRYLPAEEALVRALRLAPNEPQLLTTLGQVYLLMEDWPRLQQVEDTLRGLDTPQAVQTADQMKVQRLSAQGRAEDSVAFLEQLASDGTGDGAAQIAVMRARLLSGDREGAIDYARQALAAAPDNMTLKFALALIEAAGGDYAEAETGYREILAVNPKAVPAWLALIRVTSAQGNAAAAEAVADEAIAAVPDMPDLLWAKGEFLEKSGRIDEAITLYQKLYDLAPNSPIAANNLGSLISSYRDDDASLERAYTVVRRLKGTEEPAFQDTYGWIANRRGNAGEAVGYLEPAAKALSGDPMVQFHLGMTYLALDRKPEALAQLRRAMTIAGPGDTRTQFTIARDEIAKLEAAGVTAPDPAPDAQAPDAQAPQPTAGTRPGAAPATDARPEAPVTGPQGN